MKTSDSAGSTSKDDSLEVGSLDCNSLLGRFKDICRGYDDRGRPIDMSPQQRDAYMQRFVTGEFPPATSRATRSCCGKKKVEKPLPSLIRQGVNFAVASVKHFAAGSPQATDEQVKERLSVCESNVCGYFRESDRRCAHKKCGCFLDEKAKWLDQQCPLNLWSHHDWSTRTRVPKPNRSLKVGVMMQSVNVGGAEIWAETMCRYSRHKWSFWSDRIEVEQGAIEELGKAEIHSANWNEWRDSQDVILVWCHTADKVMPRLGGWKGEILLLSQGSGEWTARYMHSMAPYADRLFAVSEIAAGTFPEDVRRHVQIVLNSADPSRLTTSVTRTQARNLLGLTDQLAASYIGRWSYEKNPAALARAVSRMNGVVAVHKCPSYKLAEKEVSQILTPDRYRLSPMSVADTLAASDVLVLASHGEGCALIVMEALAFGVPVVSTPVGGIEEMERDHGTLVVRVPMDPSPEILAQAIMEAHSRRDELIEAGKKFSRQWDAFAMADRWDSLIEEDAASYPRAALL